MLTDFFKSKALILIGILAAILTGVILVYPTDKPTPQDPTEASIMEGQLVIESNGCRGCHQPGNMFRAPELEGLYGIERTLDDGTKVIADDAYIIESIYEPLAKVVQGYPANMPAYKDQITDLEMKDIIAYLKANSGS